MAKLAIAIHALVHVAYGLADANWFLLTRVIVFGIRSKVALGKKLINQVFGMGLVQSAVQEHVNQQVPVACQVVRA
jgi:hypothetical protein